MSTSSPPSLNSDFNWDGFDSEWYLDHNYRNLRDDDHEIMNKVRDFFAASEISDVRGVDVGPGANLYPSLAMLPFCRSLDLREFSASNVDWLRRQVTGFDENWDAFWAVYQEAAVYAAVDDPRAKLASMATVEQASVFDLPTAAWDIGTMFFVACSLSTEIAEFRRAVHCFVRALTPGAPFAAAFMEKSKGYYVGKTFFPAVAIDSKEVAETVGSVAYDVTVDRFDTSTPLRDGYDGHMILATGRAAG